MNISVFLKRIFFLWCLVYPCLLLHAQNATIELPPKFPNCEQIPNEQLRNCFFFEVQNHIYQNFKSKDSLSTSIQVLFNVNKKGKITTFYIDAPSPELKQETQRVFDLFPVVKPGIYAGNPTEQQFRLQIVLPLQKPQWEVKQEAQQPTNQHD